MDEVAKRDQNYIPVLTAITDDSSQLIRMLRVDPITGRLLISVTGTSSTGYQTATGSVDGVNQTFTFAVAPNVISVDQGRVMQKVSSDGTVNWTGTSVITLSIAPTFDIFGVA